MTGTADASRVLALPAFTRPSVRLFPADEAAGAGLLFVVVPPMPGLPMTLQLGPGPTAWHIGFCTTVSVIVAVAGQQPDALHACT